MIVKVILAILMRASAQQYYYVRECSMTNSSLILRGSDKSNLSVKRIQAPGTHLCIYALLFMENALSCSRVNPRSAHIASASLSRSQTCPPYCRGIGGLCIACEQLNDMWRATYYDAAWYKQSYLCKLTWLVLGGDPAARSHRVEQFTAL